MQEARRQQLLRLCQDIHIDMQDLELLDMALTHSSYAHESRQNPRPPHNERIEFLGDTVLSLIVSTYMYNNFPNLDEGKLTKLRAHLVCENTLFEYAHRLHMGDYLLFGRGEELNGGRERASTLADAFESVLGAIYLDQGLECARSYLLSLMQEDMDFICRHGICGDYKTFLQEYLQRNGDADIVYGLVGCEGPEHNKTFTMEVLLDGKVIGKGSGHRKKDAEQKAAKNALEELHISLA